MDWSDTILARSAMLCAESKERAMNKILKYSIINIQ
jgi:hypothetical protein